MLTFLLHSFRTFVGKSQPFICKVSISLVKWHAAYYLVDTAQWRKNTRPSLFLFAGRVSGVFCMKLNQENLNYHKNKFHSKSSQGDLIIPSSNDWVYFFHFQKSLILSYLKLTHAKNSGNSVNFSQVLFGLFLWSVVSETGLSLWFSQFWREMY